MRKAPPSPTCGKPAPVCRKPAPARGKHPRPPALTQADERSSDRWRGRRLRRPATSGPQRVHSDRRIRARGRGLRRARTARPARRRTGIGVAFFECCRIAAEVVGMRCALHACALGRRGCAPRPGTPRRQDDQRKERDKANIGPNRHTRGRGQLHRLHGAPDWRAWNACNLAAAGEATALPDAACFFVKSERRARSREPTE